MITRHAFQRTLKLIPVVCCCDRCGRFYTVCVRFEDDEDPIVKSLPDNCSCGEMIDTPDNLRDIIGTARMLIETAEFRRRTS